MTGVWEYRASWNALQPTPTFPLSLGIEAIAIGGGGSGGGAHSPNEWYNPQGREMGLQRILMILLGLSGVVDAAEG